MVWNSGHWQSDNQLRLEKAEADNLINNIKATSIKERTKRILALKDSSQTVNCINRSSFN